MDETIFPQGTTRAGLERTIRAVERVSQGEDIDQVLADELRSPSSVETVRGSCPESGCGYVEPEDKRGKVIKTCPNCKKIIYLDPSLSLEKLTLASLRPGDKFVFSGSEEVYVVLKAPRGFVSFAPERDREEVSMFELKQAINLAVEMRSSTGISSGAHKYWEGDRVLNSVDGTRGYVLGPEGSGYNVLYDGTGNSQENTKWTLAYALHLIDKETTTKSYISLNPSGEWEVRLGRSVNTYKRQPDAVSALYYRCRTAFNRWSRYVKNNPDYMEIEEDTIAFLQKNDQIWQE